MEVHFMNEQLTDDQREVCAVSVMRAMLSDYCDEKGIAFEQAFVAFSTSIAYQMLFDYSTGLWKEGPDYLRNVFEDTLESNASKHSADFISEEEMNRRLGITETDLVGFEDVEIE